MSTDYNNYVDYFRAVGYNCNMEREVIVRRSKTLLKMNIAKIAVGGVLTVPLIVIAVYLFCGVNVGWYGWLAVVSIPAIVAFINGIKGVHHHRKMPETPLAYEDGVFTVLGKDIPAKEVANIILAQESRNVGQVTVVTSDGKNMIIYNVPDYKRVAARLIDILADNEVEPFKTARDNFVKEQEQAEKAQAETQAEPEKKKPKKKR